jgi:hypothetical protein
MRFKDIIHDLGPLRAKAVRSIHARLQHELNAVHIYCRLSEFIGKPYALAFARRWERNIIYSHVLYRR